MYNTICICIRLANEQAGRKVVWLSMVWRVTESSPCPTGFHCHFNWSSEKSTGRSRRVFTGAQLTPGLLHRNKALHATFQWVPRPANRLQTFCGDNCSQTGVHHHVCTYTTICIDIQKHTHLEISCMHMLTHHVHTCTYSIHTCRRHVDVIC